ncbi:MAG: hypothetical protein R2771_03120 [Saprospiraceae bacterium]
MKKIYPNMDYEKFKKEYTSDNIHITSSTQVGATIADDISKSAFSWRIPGFVGYIRLYHDSFYKMAI